MNKSFTLCLVREKKSRYPEISLFSGLLHFKNHVLQKQVLPAETQPWKVYHPTFNNNMDNNCRIPVIFGIEITEKTCHQKVV